MKRKENKSYIILGIVILLLVLMFVVLMLSILSDRIGTLERKVDTLPKRVCHIEETRVCRTEEVKEAVTLIIKYDKRGNYMWSSGCESYSGNISCEDGVDIYSAIKEVCNWGKEPKVCIITHSKEVCEIE